MTTVLLVDGDKPDREYWAQRLKIDAPELTVLESETGAHGLTTCRSQAVDCVITELTLPDMSGLQLLVKLVPRAFQPEIPVIILTRQDLPSVQRVAKTNGAQAYFCKSQFSGEELVVSIRKALARIGPKKNRLPFL